MPEKAEYDELFNSLLAPGRRHHCGADVELTKRARLDFLPAVREDRRRPLGPPPCRRLTSQDGYRPRGLYT
jgi:hypothetical protein